MERILRRVSTLSLFATFLCQPAFSQDKALVLRGSTGACIMNTTDRGGSALASIGMERSAKEWQPTPDLVGLALWPLRYVFDVMSFGVIGGRVLCRDDSIGKLEQTLFGLSTSFGYQYQISENWDAGWKVGIGVFNTYVTGENIDEQSIGTLAPNANLNLRKNLRGGLSIDLGVDYMLLKHMNPVQKNDDTDLPLDPQQIFSVAPGLLYRF